VIGDTWLSDDDDTIDLMTKEEVAELLRVNPRTVERWAKDGELPAVKLKRTVRFHRRDVVDFLRRRTSR
jgi:excisionase family DNA binding protein